MLNNAGFKVLLIIDYCPLWLQSAHQLELNNNSINAPPSDWLVYDDIIKKIVRHIQSRVFAIEVWNEPDLSYRIEGSPYKTRLSAYLDLYFHTASDIRLVNKKIKIGGPAVADTYNTEYLQAMLSDGRNKKQLDFYSYHFYGQQKSGNISLLRNIATKYGRPDLMIFISEWNYSADFNKNPMNTNAIKAISFLGNTLINQYKEAPDVSILYCIDDYNKADSFYTMDSEGKFTPKVSTIRLMSVRLGLGTGKCKLFKTIASDKLNAMGAINHAGSPVVCMVNNEFYDVRLTIELSGLKFSGKRSVQVFEANGVDNADDETVLNNISFANGKCKILTLLIHANSVLGIKIK